MTAGGAVGAVLSGPGAGRALKREFIVFLKENIGFLRSGELPGGRRALLGGFWELGGASGELRGRFWELLGAHFNALGTILGDLGADFFPEIGEVGFSLDSIPGLRPLLCHFAVSPPRSRPRPHGSLDLVEEVRSMLSDRRTALV